MNYDDYLTVPAVATVKLKANTGVYTTEFGSIYVPKSGIATVQANEAESLLNMGGFSLYEEPAADDFIAPEAPEAPVASPAEEVKQEESDSATEEAKTDEVAETSAPDDDVKEAKAGNAAKTKAAN